MRKKVGRAIKSARVRSEQWHVLLAQKGLRKEIRSLQKKHGLRITGAKLSEQIDRARQEKALAHCLNRRNTDIRNLREKYDIPDEWDGLFFVEVVLAPIYRALTQPHEKYKLSPFTMTGLKRDGSADYYRIIIGPSVDMDDPDVIASIKHSQQQARKFYRMDKAPMTEKEVRNPRRKNWLPVLIYRLQTGATYQQIADDIGYNAKYVERQVRRCEVNYCALADEDY